MHFLVILYRFSDRYQEFLNIINFENRVLCVDIDLFIIIFFFNITYILVNVCSYLEKKVQNTIFKKILF